MIKCIIKCIVAIVFIMNTAFALTGREIMELIENKNQGHIGSTSTMTLTLIDAQDNKVERIMKAINKEAPKDANYTDKSITEFLKPLDVKGTKLLTWTMKKESNKQWLYLPNFKRIKKINAKNQAGSFMGSEFSYEDIAGHEIDKYNYKLLNETPDTWVVESIPKNSSGYTKMITTISKIFHNPITVKYFDRRSELLKTSTIEGHKPFKVGKKEIFYPSKVTMMNHQSKKKSIISWDKRKIGVKHSENKFKSQKLK